MCNCLKQKIIDISYNKSNLSNINNETFETFNLDRFSDEVDIEKFNQKISPRKNMAYIKKKCEEFVDNFDNLQYKNLLFTGNTGLGKTFMSNCIANELLKKGKIVLYQTAPVLLDTIIKNKMEKNKTTEQEEFYKNVLECDLLIIDDLGTEFSNSMTISELFTILNTRLLNSNSKVTKTIISTNLNIRQLFNNYEERIGSRIAGFYDIYYFFGDDLRLKRTK
jgi:DNA replication protein DnaC